MRQTDSSVRSRWQSVVCCGIPLVGGSRGEGATVWPWGEQQIRIGVGLEHVPNKCRVEKWKAAGNVVVWNFFGAVYWVWFLGLLRFGLVDPNLMIGLITNSECDPLPRDG